MSAEQIEHIEAHNFIPLRWNDFDRYGHLNNCAFVEMAQEARTQFLRTRFEEVGEEMGVFVRHVEVDFLRPVMPDTKKVEVVSEVVEIGNTSFKTRQEIKDRQGRVAGVVTTVLVMVDLSTATPREISQKEIGILESVKRPNTDESAPAELES
ncbi:acyl-CoA thioesterase [Corynebacterium aquatimens]|uniref:Acyl-CoA thioester hydrolase n=1 Tax=Corynebacterium aquatimens TaxID=1190508 RepID=A0A931DVD5_9CORY|nr:thioesterase family protein [Corynebacterium aquatimens]MBG6122214.1 acyl-CoA thioester hydrolase [Corynebacterium aquatimens]WJY65245.1 acyl-CoA thioesterase YbgC [Corynebacterium aquatimens]